MCVVRIVIGIFVVRGGFSIRRLFGLGGGVISGWWSLRIRLRIVIVLVILIILVRFIFGVGGVSIVLLIIVILGGVSLFRSISGISRREFCGMIIG